MNEKGWGCSAVAGAKKAAVHPTPPPVSLSPSYASDVLLPLVHMYVPPLAFSFRDTLMHACNRKHACCCLLLLAYLPAPRPQPTNLNRSIISAHIPVFHCIVS